MSHLFQKSIKFQSLGDTGVLQDEVLGAKLVAEKLSHHRSIDYQIAKQT